DDGALTRVGGRYAARGDHGVRHGDAVGLHQLDAADDFARRAVDPTRDVDDGVGCGLVADHVHAQLAVRVVHLAVGVAGFPVDVLDEADVAHVAAQADDIALQVAVVLLVTRRTVQLVLGAGVGDRARDHAGRVV